MRIFPPLALLYGLIVAITVDAEIYKWTDEEGNVHYGDRPPVSSESTEVQTAPPPSDQTIRETQDRFKRLKDYKTKLRDSRKEETIRAEKSVASALNDVECFASLADSWGGKIRDTREEVKPRLLADTELRQLMRLFNKLKGPWKGEMKETSCVRPDTTPTSKVYHYNIRLDGRWKADHLFELDAELEGEESDADLRKQYFWIFLDADGLRFRKAMSNIMPELDKPRYDVEILTSGSKSIVFFFRRGGAVRRTSVFYLERNGRRFSISEYFYAQGKLAGKRLWKMGQ